MNRLYLATIMSMPLFISCASQQVSYRDDVLPILEDRCIQCHLAPDGPGYLATGLEMDSYHSLIQGTFYGPVIVAGDSRRSILNILVEKRQGEDPRCGR